jgi:hypothetical protein
MAQIDTTPNQAASGKGVMPLSLFPKRLGRALPEQHRYVRT